MSINDPRDNPHPFVPRPDYLPQQFPAGIPQVFGPASVPVNQQGPQVCKTPGVWGSVQYAKDRIEFLDSEILKLYDRLSPVMTTDKSTPSSVREDHSAKCGLEQEIRRLGDIADELLSRVQLIIISLEI